MYGLSAAMRFVGVLAKHLHFVFAIRQVKRSRSLVPDTRRREHVEPDLKATSGQLTPWAKRLSDRPEHSKIANRGAAGARILLENDDAAPPSGKLKGVSEPENSGSDHGVVVVPTAIHAVKSLGLMPSNPWASDSARQPLVGRSRNENARKASAMQRAPTPVRIEALNNRVSPVSTSSIGL